MKAAAGQLLRRGIEAHASLRENQRFAELEVSNWVIAIMSLTILAWFVALISVNYTFGTLIPTLLMVEAPEAVLYIEPLDDKEADATLSKGEPELLLVKQQPITSSFRRTLATLGGFPSRFRGFGLYLVHNIAVGWFSQMIAVLPFIPRGTSEVFALVIFANFSMAWTHIVISAPNAQPWFKRLPSARLFKRIAGPTALAAIASQLTVVVPATLALVFGAGHADHKHMKNMSGSDRNVVALQAIAVLVVAIGMYLCVEIPASVMLVRVQASLLDDAEETIVPFDRSYGGKVVPELVGGSGVLGVLDAWKSFDWNARVRLIKAYFKVFAMQVALTVFFFLAVVAEIVLIVGISNLEKLIPSEGNPGVPGNDEIYTILPIAQ